MKGCTNYIVKLTLISQNLKPHEHPSLKLDALLSLSLSTTTTTSFPVIGTHDMQNFPF